MLLQAEETREDMLRVLSISGDAGLFPEAAPMNSQKGWDGLTPREREVLLLVAEGYSNKQIAQELYIADATAKAHVSHILEKLGVASRTAAALRVPPTTEIRRRSARTAGASGSVCELKVLAPPQTVRLIRTGEIASKRRRRSCRTGFHSLREP